MATKDEYVNYTNFGKHVTDMEENGSNLSESFRTAFQTLAEANANSVWKGQNYDAIVELFNGFIMGNNTSGANGLNSIIESVGEKIPSAMAKTARDWSNYDQNPVNVQANEKMNLIVEIPKSGQKALTYDPNAIDSTVKKIIESLQKGNTCIENTKTLMDKLGEDWKGSDYDNNKADVNKYQSEVSSDVTKMIDELKRLFELDRQEYNATLGTTTENLQTK